MARSNRDADDSGGSGWGKWLGIGIGLGAAAVGAVGAGLLLYDEIQKQKEEKAQLEAEEAEQARVAKKTRALDSPDRGACAFPSSGSDFARQDPAACKSADCKPDSLHTQLQDYLDDYVKINPILKTGIKNEMSEILDSVSEHLSQKSSMFNTSDLQTMEPFQIEKHVISAKQFTIYVPLNIDDTMWEAVDGRCTLQGEPGYLLIHRVPNGDSEVTPFDQYAIGGYLSPVKINRVLADLMADFRYLSSTIDVKKSDTVTITKHSYNTDEPITIELCPVLQLGEDCIVANPHPRWKEGDGSLENFWQHSFERATWAKLTGCGCGSCALDCYRLIKAVYQNWPTEFGQLPWSVYDSLMLQLLDDEEEWSQHSLPERFIDFLITLQSHLVARNLQHYFIPEVNLLNNYDPQLLDNFRQFLTRIIGDNNVHTLLRKGRIVSA